MVDRRDLDQEVAVALEIAIFGGAVLAPPRAGGLQHGDEVSDAVELHPGGPEVGKAGECGEHHEATIAAAHDRDPPRLGDPLLDQVAMRMGKVGHAVRPQANVVEAGIVAAIAGGAADVGCEHDEAAMHQILDLRLPNRQVLRLRTAMHEDDGAAPGPGRGRLRAVEQGRDHPPVEALEAHHLRLDGGLAGQPGAVARRHLPQRVRGEIVEVNVRIVGRAVEGEGDAAAVGRPFQLLDHAWRRQRDRSHLPAGEVADGELAEAVDVGDQRQPFLVGRQLEDVDVPIRRVDPFERAALDVEEGRADMIAALVGGEIEAAAILAPAQIAVERLAVVGGERRQRAAGEIEAVQPEVE